VALALYRKYRPRTFAEVIGQEHVTEPLSQALRTGRLHHAYLFSGPRGCGKTSSARILARSLNCEQGPTPEPCGVCASCRSLANDGAGSIDVIEIDAASHGGVDDARDLREKAFFAPASSRYKIYVIDEAHMVSPAGFNALLKLVEEPPEYVKFIFATTEPEKVLGTIRSRTHHYPFRLIPPATLRPYLQQLTEAEGIPVEPAVFPLVVRAGGGSARDTLSVLDQLIAGAGPDGVSYSRAVALLGVTDVTLIDEMCDALAAGDGAAAYSTIDRVAEAGHDARRFASDLLERFRDLIILQQVPDAVSKGLIDGPTDQVEAMSAQATRLGPATLSRCADIVHNGLVEMRGTTAPRLLLELITARMLLPGAEDSTGALLQRLERMERRLMLSGDAPVRTEAEPAAPPSANGAAAANAPVADSAPVSGGGLSAARAAAAAASRRSAAPAAGTGRRPAAGSSAPTETPAESSPAEAPAAPSPTAPATSAQNGEPDWNDVAEGGEQSGPAAAVSAAPGPIEAASPSAGALDAGGYDDEPPWDDEPEPYEPESPTPRARVAEPEPESATPRARVAGPAASAPAVATSAPGRVTPPARVAETDSAALSSPPAPATAPSEPEHAAAPSAPEPSAAPSAPEPAGASARHAEPAGQMPEASTPRAEPAGVMPDAPEEPGLAAVEDAVPGQLTAAAVREVWPEIVTAIGRQSKRLAALLAGAVVRDFNGQTVTLTFRYPKHAEMVTPAAPAVANALYEALGGRWEIRCEVSGEGGAVAPAPAPRSGSGRGGPAAASREPARNEAPTGVGPGRATATAPGAQQAQAAAPRPPQSRRREAEAPASSGGDDDWPEPVKPGGMGTRAAPQPESEPEEDWPEVSPIGVSAQSDAAGPDSPRPGTRPEAATNAGTWTESKAVARDDRAGDAPGGQFVDARSGQVTDPRGGQVADASGGQSAEVRGGQVAGARGGDVAGATNEQAAGARGGHVSDAPHQQVAGSSSGPAAVDASSGLPSSGGGTSASGLRSAGVAVPGEGGAVGGAGDRDERSASAPSEPVDGRAQGRPASARPAAQESTGAAGGGAAVGSSARRNGLAAARAAAAAAGNAAARQAAARTAGGAAQPAVTSAPANAAWADGSPTEEAPYDPEFDGPPKAGGGRGFEGFDPGDEPLDDVIDEKTARESGEQQAMRLLQDALGAEKIGEV
jgi:DNA polymerase-3 subunit gamma/tau